MSCTHGGRSKETEMDGGKHSLLAILKGELQWLIDIQTDLILMKGKKKKTNNPTAAKSRNQQGKRWSENMWRLGKNKCQHLEWGFDGKSLYALGGQCQCVSAWVCVGIRRQECRLKRHSITPHINKGRRSVRSHAAHPSDCAHGYARTNTYNLKQPFCAQAGGTIGHPLIGNVINSQVTGRHAIILILSR